MAWAIYISPFNFWDLKDNCLERKPRGSGFYSFADSLQLFPIYGENIQVIPVQNLLDIATTREGPEMGKEHIPSMPKLNPWYH